MTVFNLKKRQTAVIKKLNAIGAEKQRLVSLGLKEGAHITVASFSLFKSSVLVFCGATRLALRRALAERIEVDGVKNCN